MTGAVREVFTTPQRVFADGATRQLAFRRDFCEHLASAELRRPRTGQLARAADSDVAGA
ncbi:hypothetical protein AB0B66_07905 [Catellatospora sp. NPDC049111]|uniref:hypothetical protein n=1 Tax=Catellatospora sp. NPDC049111 TaxID=3155271 RepID=UPI0033EBABA1